jgi:hypothetical protein
MENHKWSEATSNFLLVTSVLLALTPFLLGDQLILVATRFIKEASVMIDQFPVYLASLLS